MSQNLQMQLTGSLKMKDDFKLSDEKLIALFQSGDIRLQTRLRSNKGIQ